MMRPRITLITALGLALATAGCGTTPPSQFYLLSATGGMATEQAEPETAAQPVNVGLGPIEFPAYLDRSKIVVRTSENTLKAAEYHRWAEPLESNFARVLAANLAHAMPSADVIGYPWNSGKTVDVQVLIRVLRFDTDNKNQSRLHLRWELLDKGKQPLQAAQSREYTTTARSGDYEQMVQAMSECVGLFSKDLATSIKLLKNK